MTVGLVVSTTAPLLAHTFQARLSLLVVTAGMTALLLVTFVVPWHAISRPWLLTFPLGVFAAVAALGLAGQKLGSPYSGVFVLCFAYTGLTQTSRINLGLVPVAAAAWFAATDVWTTTLTIRLVIVICVWILLSQLLCAMAARNAALTAALRATAHTDTLTGLPNRRDLDERLLLTGSTDTVVLCDLDYFKQFNDTHGHLAGDRLLSEFGFMLRACLRDGDYASRFGGEEFALVLPNTSTTDAQAVLSRLRQHWAIMQPDVTFSSGLTTCSAHARAEAELGAADQALYEAKALGRNQDRIALAAA